MKVVLNTSLAGERFAFVARQVITCGDRQGKKLIDAGLAEAAPEGAKSEGELPDRGEPGPDPKKKPERPAKRPVETPEGNRPAPEKSCAGKTAAGNPCARQPKAGSEFCAAHQPK